MTGVAVGLGGFSEEFAVDPLSRWLWISTEVSKNGHPLTD